MLLRVMIKKVMVRAAAKVAVDVYGPLVNAIWNGITVFISITDCKFASFIS